MANKYKIVIESSWTKKEALEGLVTAFLHAQSLYENARNFRDDSMEAEADLIRDAVTERLEAEGQDFCWMFRLMLTARRCGRDFPDLAGSIQDDRIPQMIATFRKFGVPSFTISSGYSNMNKTVWAFKQHGAALNGITEIVADEMARFGSEEPVKTPAFSFIVMQERKGEKEVR